MSIDIRLPNINAPTEREKMIQMQSYLHQLVQQLNWALNNIETGNVVNTDSASQAQGNTITDINIAISEKEAQSTFNSIKALIMGSTDIVEAYYQAMKENLDGEYVEDSDFGSFVEKTNHDIETASDAANSVFNDVSMLKFDIIKIDDALSGMNSWIRSGLLDYDANGVPVYGTEVGQTKEANGEKVFDKIARFTSGGIFFYLPGAKDAVAWME